MPNVLRFRTTRPLRVTLLAVAVAASFAVSFAAPAAAEDEDSAEPGPAPSAGPPAEIVRDVMVPPADPDAILGDLPAEQLPPRLSAILAAHPDSDAVICLAGCGGGPRIVALRKRGTPSPEAAPPSAARIEPASAPLPADGVQVTPAGEDIGDVICLAGCAGAPGEVVQRNVRLTWIDGGASEDLKAALRGVAERLASGAAHEATPPRAWMSDGARAHFADAPLPPVLATLVSSAAPLSRR